MFIIETVAGLVLLVAGGDLLIRGATAIARRLGVSPLLIGLTLLGFGTSTPELFTSVTAALDGAPGIAVGNVVGSNTANILLILGMAALLRPLAVPVSGKWRDGIATLAAAMACTALVAYGELPRLAGIALLLGLALYLGIAYRHERTAGGDGGVAEDDSPLPGWGRAAAFTLAGFALIFLGADWLVTGAIEIAAAAGVSDTLVGLTLVAVGTSLPELVTSIIAALRRQGDIAIGNVLGSNIYNVLAILGVTALVQPIPVPAEILLLDIWVMLGATLALLLLLTWRRLGRGAGAVLLGGYLAYLTVLAVQAT
ncbi:calcium/sodium antiporter [Marinibaculum pumilum]|uniref:Calcium/sodium antiporter n=1 Tax=Marinibaculum pumilum TaxID=1766165 RepID=A0ABV7L940_9PROT